MEEVKNAGTLQTDSDGMAACTQQDILKQLRMQTFFTKITAAAGCGIFLVLLVSSLILVPKISNTTAEADKTIEKANAAIDTVNELAETAESSLGDITTATDNANDLIVANAENLTEVIEKINRIDFDSLNDSIEALHDTIAPFQKIVGAISAFTGK